MLPRTFKVSTDDLSRQASYYLIGFARLTERNNIEDAVSSGSGTLVTVGSLHGVLTAAHVADKILEMNRVGIIRNIDSPAHYEKLTINMEHVERPIMIRSSEFGPLGPDLAFFRIPDDETLGWLRAKNSFYSLSKRRDEVLARKQPAGSHTDIITGTVHELTEEAPSDRKNVRRVNFHAIFCGVRPSAVRFLDSHDLAYFQLATEHEPSFKIPNSFEGVSGGAVWRYYVIEERGEPKIVDSRLIAVPFHQSLASDGKREIACHGAKSIYGTLIDEIRARWPTVSNSEEKT